MEKMNNDVIIKLEKYFSQGMTPFQMRNFVVNEFLTDYRKLRQIVLEVNSRLNNKETQQFDLESKRIDLDQLKSESHEDIFAERKRDLEIRMAEREIEKKEQSIRQLENEIEVFREAIEQLTERQGGYDAMIEKLNSDEWHEEEERLFWIEKLGRSATGDMVNYGTISKGVFESITLLDDEAKDKVLRKAINNQFDLMQLMNETKEQLLLEND